uniref:Uncharacterized protein n=1 Tax=Trichuris muris TaxID=70415 RepID=A0A5S6Q970_TRIMR
MQWQKCLLVFSVVVLLVFCYHVQRDRWRLQDYYSQNSEKLKQALDSVSAQLQAVYQQKLRLQKSLKQKLDNEEQMKKDLRDQLHSRNMEYQSERDALQKELNQMKMELKLLRQSSEKLVQQNHYLNAKLNYEKMRCTTELEFLKKPLNRTQSASHPMEHAGDASVVLSSLVAPLALQNFTLPLFNASERNLEGQSSTLGLQNGNSTATDFRKANESQAMAAFKLAPSLDTKHAPLKQSLMAWTNGISVARRTGRTVTTYCGSVEGNSVEKSCRREQERRSKMRVNSP